MNYVVEFERDDGTFDETDTGSNYDKACRLARNLSEPLGRLVYVVAVDSSGARVGHVLYARGYRADVEGVIR